MLGIERVAEGLIEREVIEACLGSREQVFAIFHQNRDCLRIPELRCDRCKHIEAVRMRVEFAGFPLPYGNCNPTLNLRASGMTSRPSTI